MAEHPAVQAATPAMVGLLRGLGYPAVLAEARGPRVARLAAPEVLRWAAGNLPSGTDDLLAWLRRHRLSTTPGVGQVLAAVRADLEAVADAVDRDTRTEAVGRGR